MTERRLPDLSELRLRANDASCFEQNSRDGIAYAFEANEEFDKRIQGAPDNFELFEEAANILIGRESFSGQEMEWQRELSFQPDVKRLTQSDVDERFGEIAYLETQGDRARTVRLIDLVNRLMEQPDLALNRKDLEILYFLEGVKMSSEFDEAAALNFTFVTRQRDPVKDLSSIYDLSEEEVPEKFLSTLMHDPNLTIFNSFDKIVAAYPGLVPNTDAQELMKELLRRERDRGPDEATCIDAFVEPRTLSKIEACDDKFAGVLMSASKQTRQELRMLWKIKSQLGQFENLTQERLSEVVAVSCEGDAMWLLLNQEHFAVEPDVLVKIIKESNGDKTDLIYFMGKVMEQNPQVYTKALLRSGCLTHVLDVMDEDMPITELDIVRELIEARTLAAEFEATYGYFIDNSGEERAGDLGVTREEFNRLLKVQNPDELVRFMKLYSDLFR